MLRKDGKDKKIGNFYVELIIIQAIGEHNKKRDKDV
jgi:hypothetical protein